MSGTPTLDLTIPGVGRIHRLRPFCWRQAIGKPMDDRQSEPN